jgi:DNA-binding CsgD family transcriptional regulator
VRKHLHGGVKPGLRNQLRIRAMQGKVLPLSTREHQILRLMCRGYVPQEISMAVGLAPSTIRVHRAHLLKKLKARNLAQMIRSALTVGFISPNFWHRMTKPEHLITPRPSLAAFIRISRWRRSRLDVEEDATKFGETEMLSRWFFVKDLDVIERTRRKVFTCQAEDLNIGTRTEPTGQHDSRHNVPYVRWRKNHRITIHGAMYVIPAHSR